MARAFFPFSQHHHCSYNAGFKLEHVFIAVVATVIVAVALIARGDTLSVRARELGRAAAVGWFPCRGSRGAVALV